MLARQPRGARLSLSLSSGRNGRLEGDLPQVTGVPASALKLEYNLQHL